MKRYALSNILDTVFKTVIIFAICFVWIRYYVYSLNETLLYTILLTIIINLIFLFFKKKKEKNEKINKDEQLKINECVNEFLFSSHKKNTQFFYKLLQKKHKVTYQKPFLIITKSNGKIGLLPYYKNRKLTMDTVKNFIILAKKKELKKLIICCKTSEQEVLNLCKQYTQIKLLILDAKQTYYKLLKPYNYFPQIVTNLIEEQKLTTSQMLVVMFDKKRTKGYVISAVILLFTSFIVPYNIYYVIFSSFLFLLALFSYFNTSFHKKLPENIIEEDS